MILIKMLANSSLWKNGEGGDINLKHQVQTDDAMEDLGSNPKMIPDFSVWIGDPADEHPGATS